LNSARVFLIAGALFGMAGVVLGAFGAHALKTKLDAASLSSWDTAVLYQVVHALALFAVGIWLRQGGNTTALNVAGWSFLIGVFLFSGSLYLLAGTSARWLGPVTPLGGVAFVVGWAALVWAALKIHD
jgi:uncharacterized membrane protein YgdD (TMEM256/DUF423 family)